MTPTEIETAARRAYNAVGDTFWSQDEILTLMYLGSMQLADEGIIIERTFETTTVVGQLEYDYPTNAIGIKRVEYDGKRLDPITMDEDDVLTSFDADTTSTGTPTNYFIWNDTVMLRPIPNAALTLKIRAYIQPTIPTIVSELELPTLFHPALVDFCIKEMVLKDGNIQVYDRYEARWQNWIVRAKSFKSRTKQLDKYPVVKDYQIMDTTYPFVPL
jgi:hypothetical protein